MFLRLGNNTLKSNIRKIKSHGGNFCEKGKSLTIYRGYYAKGVYFDTKNESD